MVNCNQLTSVPFKGLTAEVDTDKLLHPQQFIIVIIIIIIVARIRVASY